MSTYIDNFIRQHKEYFLRNKKVIENNKWNNSENFDKKMNQLATELLLVREQNEDVVKKVEDIEDNIRKLASSSRKNKEALFNQENELTNSILGRLSAFIRETESRGDRKLPRVQSFVDMTVDIIRLHLDKCDTYLDYNLDILTEDDDSEIAIENKDHEIIFQDTIFQKKIKVQEQLEKLNINGEIQEGAITFYKDEKATIPMLSILSEVDANIKQLTKDLNLPTEVWDKEFLISKIERGDTIPQWNESKHYWEQDKDVLLFWWNEWLKINKTFYIDGYEMHPWLYFHLNIYKTPIPQADGSEPVINPYLRDNEWYLAELLKEAERRKDRGILLYGTRRYAKSVTMSSVCDWKALTKSNASTSITSGSAGDLGELIGKIKTSMEYRVPAFKLTAQKQDWEKEVIMGLKKDSQNHIPHSRHTIKNLDGGATTATQKTAGGAPSVFLIEEIGKAPWEKPYVAAQPSFETEFGWKTIVILVGTSGEAALSGDAMKAVTNPDSFKCLEMDWDLLEKTLPEGFEPTWKRRTFANFVPAQMAYKTGFKRIEKGFGEFLGIKSEALDAIKIFQTDWVNNTDVLKKAREAEKDAFKLQQLTVQYPIDPEECFLSPDKNPFPYIEAKNHKDYIIKEGKTGKKVFLLKESNGKIVAEFAENKPLAEYPHTGGFIDSPGLLFEDLPEDTPPPHLYVAGFDDYKQEESDNSESVGTLYIKKVDIPGVKNANKIVFSMSARPDPHGKLHKQWLLALEAFNARAFGENEDMDFKKHLDTKRGGLTDKFLVGSMDFESEMQISYGGNRKYGWKPTTKNIKFLFGLFVEYCNTEFTIIDENGDERTVLGVQMIDDVALLDEIINYSKEKNVDRITAMMGCMGYEFHLHMNYMFPKIKAVKDKEEQKKVTSFEKNLAQRMFGNKNSGNLFR